MYDHFSGSRSFVSASKGQDFTYTMYHQNYQLQYLKVSFPEDLVVLLSLPDLAAGCG